MSANRRGLIILGILIVALFLCYLITFVVLPGNNIAVGLPVITVPGEAYNGAVPSEDFNWTNTLTATLLADLAVLLFVFFAWRSSNGWKKEVPGRFQAWAEMVGEFVYNQTKGFAGTRPLARNWLFPLAASILVFLLAANWMKLLPGVESVGIFHCAHEGFSGYPGQQVGNNAFQLYVDQPLYAGQGATHDDYDNCHEWLEHGAHLPAAADREAAATRLFNEEASLDQQLTAENVSEAQRLERINALRLEVTESLYEHPSYALTADQIRGGAIPYVTVVTPFVRGPATDLNLTIGLALISVFAIQAFGVAAQGPAYFQKFVNVKALGTMQKKPLGAIDFLVGLFEIVSELGKIISLAFRLFGNMFAGGILLAVMSFLVATLLPVIFYGLEVIVTSIQAYVFAVLTIVFSAQAMEGHHSDDEDHPDPHAADSHAAEVIDPDSQPLTRTAI